jgi:hypothetical protein
LHITRPSYVVSTQMIPKKREKQVALRKILKSMMFATAALSICFIFDGSNPLHAQGAYQPRYGGAYQPGYGGAYQSDR